MLFYVFYVEIFCLRKYFQAAFMFIKVLLNLKHLDLVFVTSNTLIKDKFNELERKLKEVKNIFNIYHVDIVNHLFCLQLSIFVLSKMFFLTFKANITS